MNDEITGLTPGERYRSADAWTWAHENPECAEAAIELDASSVCAVMVVHNAAEWLPRQLLALASLDPRPGSIIAVDNGSSDDSSALLRRALDEGVISELVRGEEGQGFGEAVHQALAGRAGFDWLWLLHDDAAPKPGALAQLLLTAAAKQADVLFPKLLAPQRRNYPDQVLEVGRSIGSDGRDVRGFELGDIDQQHLDTEPTLGGSTAGLFVSARVWAELGGFDPAIPLFRDGVEFGWRANEHGYRVLTCPQAALYHRQAGRLGWRESVLAPHPQALDRLGAMRMIAARAERPGWARVRLWWISVLRMIGFLLGKSPGQAADEWRALRRFQASGEDVTRMRERLAAAGAPAIDTSKLRPGRFASVRDAADRFAGAVVERYRDLFSTESDTSIDELTGGDYAGYERRRRAMAPLAVMSTALLVLGLVANRAHLGAADALAGGNLLAAPGTLGQAWASFLTPDPGVPGTSPLWLGIMALGSTLALGQPGWWVFLILLLAPLLAAWSANACIRPWVEDPKVRAVLSAAWGLSVWVLGFAGSGSLTGIAWAIGLPMFIRAVDRWRHRPSVGAERWRGPASAAGWLTLLAAAYPVAWPLAVVAGVAWALAERARIAEIGVALLGPAVLMAGWAPALIAHPARLLTGTDPLASATVADSPWLLAGVISEGAPHPVVGVGFFLGLLIAAAWMIASGRTRGIAAWCAIGMVGIGYLAAAGLSRLILPVSGGHAPPELGPWLLLAVAGFLLAVTAAAGQGDEPAPGAGLVPVALGTGLALVCVSVAGVPGPVEPSSSGLPSYVTAVQLSKRQGRTLMVDVNGTTARWSVAAAEQPRWGSAEHHLVSAAPELAREFSAIAQAFAQGQLGEDAARRLAGLGVAHVWLRGPPTRSHRSVTRPT
ncbi:MAG: glycosyltransferase family 2 protein [Propionibacteriaceae bacterium]|nr:glycosyltransferase family 2 protein [Propionibacteriaceae bacterium]